MASTETVLRTGVVNPRQGELQTTLAPDASLALTIGSSLFRLRYRERPREGAAEGETILAPEEDFQFGLEQQQQPLEVSVRPGYIGEQNIGTVTFEVSRVGGINIRGNRLHEAGDGIISAEALISNAVKQDRRISRTAPVIVQGRTGGEVIIQNQGSNPVRWTELVR